MGHRVSFKCSLAPVLLTLFGATTLADYILDDFDPSITYNSPVLKDLYCLTGATYNFLNDSVNGTIMKFKWRRIHGGTLRVKCYYSANAAQFVANRTCMLSADEHSMAYLFLHRGVLR